MDVSLKDLSVRYGEVLAVDDVTLAIPSGELLVLLGPSGCGKTSTMRSIAGLEEPVAGTITIGQETVFDSSQRVNVAANKRDVGMVFQSYAIWPHRTVFKNVAFPLKMQRRPKQEIKERVQRTLELVGLRELGQRGASKLSGGQMQRVALARSLAMEPKVLLLDEPLSNLDARLRDTLRFELRQMQQELRLTTVYVTHDQSEALALADRIAIMRAGKIVQLDDPVSLYQRPASTFVADFMGTANLWPARPLPGDGSDRRHVKLTGADLTVATTSLRSDASNPHVCIRPEVAELLPANGLGTQQGDNRWPASVEVASFLGTQFRYRVKLDGGPEMDVVSHDIQRPFAVGDRVIATAPPESVLVLGD